MSVSRPTRTVYGWFDPDVDPRLPARLLPAVRLWGEVLLELVAESSPHIVDPPVAIRSRSLFAWTTPLPPESFAGETARRRRQQIVVVEDECAAGRIDFVHELFQPASWRGLATWLNDRGHEAELVDEALTPVTSPFAPMVVDSARRAVESTELSLLGDVVGYFQPIAEQYLNSWGALATVDEHPYTEVVVPRGAVIRFLP